MLKPLHHDKVLVQGGALLLLLLLLLLPFLSLHNTRDGGRTILQLSVAARRNNYLIVSLLLPQTARMQWNFHGEFSLRHNMFVRTNDKNDWINMYFLTLI